MRMYNCLNESHITTHHAALCGAAFTVCTLVCIKTQIVQHTENASTHAVCQYKITWSVIRGNGRSALITLVWNVIDRYVLLSLAYVYNYVEF